MKSDISDFQDKIFNYTRNLVNSAKNNLVQLVRPTETIEKEELIDQLRIQVSQF
jgi:hypothetical protein